ncbi:DUF1259 domain-containing protein [Nonomuraea sp. NPDC049400]|uniref:DUF1259 domain-containing protein n=1 Tax=Nonomuraea sp. NPDC049400 TaxID=3364352 RepID=UPI0037BD1716
MCGGTTCTLSAAIRWPSPALSRRPWTRPPPRQHARRPHPRRSTWTPVASIRRCGPRGPTTAGSTSSPSPERSRSPRTAAWSAPAWGVNTALNFQPTGGGKAAVNGDFVMTAGEVQHVIRALRAGGIDIVELHQHALDDQPRLFYMHFWAVDDGVKLARALRTAVDAHNVTPAG